MNHYQALGVPVTASPKEIRTAYLAAARRHHPDFHATDDDRNRADHARTMQQINEAWAVLGDPAARQAYDLTLDVPKRTARARPEAPPGKGWTPRADDDGWQKDFTSWARADSRLPDEVGDGPAVVKLAPLGLFVLGILVGFVAMAIDSRGLLAASFVAIACSTILFLVLPAREMLRSRDRR